MPGKRGEGWLAVQFLLMALVFFSPFGESVAFPLLLRALGLLLVLAGGAFGLAGIIGLGSNISPFPKPREGGRLVTDGTYGVVRHPIYSGITLGSFGWGLATGSPLGLALTVLLFVFLDLKSRREEQWLTEAYPDYPAYRRRVKKLVPWVY